ncbi:epsin-3-like isoform X1 [Antennarius striatus]|uniref:epsin-3-like isoform X1 n=1 Tax=Antennarius striatus TaxID=241820 RepID=UPI0035B45D1B
MTSSMLRRQLKNLVQNYSEAEVKVREATSNDPWGPSSSQMADLSDLTYNVVACNEIMTMLWKRLKDDRNWRHIHKSLTLLEYLLKTGDDRVLLKMKDNIYIVKALTEYRFVEKDGKDQGANVREKAKVVLVLMEDDEKLKEERDFAVKTREKTSKGSTASSADTIKDPSYKPCYVPGASGLPSLDNIPSVADLTASFAARKEERLKQEAEKKEAVRRAGMSEDELKWEDAGKETTVKEAIWGSGANTESQEAEPEAVGGPKDAAASSDAWGAPTKSEEDPFVKNPDPFKASEDKPDRFNTPKDDPFNAPKKDPFNAPKDDPFNAPKDDPFNAPKDDPFNAPKDDPFNAPKDDPFNAPKDDPFNAPKDDPFNAPKDDPFNAPKDDPFNAHKDDPFNSPKDDPFNAPKDDPFNAPKDDPFNAPKDYPFNASKDDPFNAPKDDPFNAPKDDPFNAPKDDPFNAPKDDPFNAPTDDPFNAPKDDPFNAPKDDPFNAPKDDPFNAPKDDPFNAPKDDPFNSPKDDPFTAPKEDPFNAPKDDPLNAPTDNPVSSPPPTEDPFLTQTPPNDDPFEGPPCSPKHVTSDPFSAPPLTPPHGGADAWVPPASSPPAAGADPWGGGASASSTLDNSDPFGDSSKPDNDPWGATAAAPVSTSDAWGSPASPSHPPSGDPFGDGASKKEDPWGAPSHTPSETGRRPVQDQETRSKTASFLGPAGAGLVDMDDLFSSEPKRRPPVDPVYTPTRGAGKDGGGASPWGASCGVLLSA